MSRLNTLRNLITQRIRENPYSLTAAESTALRQLDTIIRTLQTRDLKASEVETLNKALETLDKSSARNEMEKKALQNAEQEFDRYQANGANQNAAAAQANRQHHSTAPVGAPSQPGANASELSRILSGQLTSSQDLNVHTIDLKHIIQQIRSLTLGRQDASLQGILRALPQETVRGEQSSLVADILGRIMLARIIEKLVKSISDKSNGGSVTEKMLEAAVKELNNSLRLASVETKTKSASQVRKDKETLERERELGLDKEASSDRNVRFEVSYNRARNTMEISINGRATERDLVTNARNLFSNRPEQALPLIIEAAARLVAGNASYRSEVVRVVTGLFTQVSDANVNFETIYRSVSRTLITKPAATPSMQIGTPSGQILSELRAEISRSIMSTAPQITIPALLKEYNRASITKNQTAMNDLAKVISDVARTDEGRKFIISAFSSNRPPVEMTSTAAGKSIVIQTVSDILAGSQSAAKAAVETRPEAKTNLHQIKDAGQRQMEIAKQLASANQALLGEKLAAAEGTAYLAASDFLKAVNQVNRAIELVGKGSLVKASKRSKAAAANKVNAKSRAAGSRTASKRPAQQAKLTATMQAMHELKSTLKSTGLTMSSTIVENIYSGMVGLNLISEIKGMTGNINSPAEQSKSTATMLRVIEALEAQVQKAAGTRAARSVSSATAAKAAEEILAHSPRLLYYGIILRLVRLDGELFELVYSKLREKGRTKALINDIKKGDVDEATDEVLDMVWTVSSVANRQSEQQKEEALPLAA
ncbi:MAG: hypothetical protein PHH60_01165 [Candidatus Margulisbacteria bacterium]|nr:hypothetical protein [Candidatus Margulisiibacteriota bacterium]